MESIAQFWPDFDSVITSAYGHGDEAMVQVILSDATYNKLAKFRIFGIKYEIESLKGRHSGHSKAYQS